MMRTPVIAFLIAALMFCSSVVAFVARSGTKTVQPGPSLEAMIPQQFGDWREESIGMVQVVDPQIKEVLDADYSQIVNRYYVNSERYMMMLSVAYGSGSGPLRLHKPETCYTGGGFTVHTADASEVVTPYGGIPVRRLVTSKGPRAEPVTYWLRVGDKATTAWRSELVKLGYTLSGRAPEGLIFRVSSIDRDQRRAMQLQDQFVNQLLASVSPDARKHLSGLGNKRGEEGIAHGSILEK